MSGEIITAVLPVVTAFEALGVSYRIGGSVASSALGVPRSTLDVDLVCNLGLPHVSPIVAALQDAYYADSDMMTEAIRLQSSFNLIHLDTMPKVDVFVRKSTPWDREAFSRKIRRTLDGSGQGPHFDLTTAEDIILHKLLSYRMSGGSSERQLRDATGVIAVQSAALDRAYLEHWAPQLGVQELLARVFAEASG